MDPESGLDSVWNVGIRDGKIVALSDAALSGREVLDVRGLVVAPGFIDLHAHGQDNVSNSFQARDGVTTALDLEAGSYPLEDLYAKREGRSILHYGVSVGRSYPVSGPTAEEALLDFAAGFLRKKIEKVS